MTDSDPLAIAQQQLAELASAMDNIIDRGMRIEIANLAIRIEIAQRLRGIEQSLDNGLRVWIDR